MRLPDPTDRGNLFLVQINRITWEGSYHNDPILALDVTVGLSAKIARDVAEIDIVDWHQYPAGDQ